MSDAFEVGGEQPQAPVQAPARQGGRRPAIILVALIVGFLAIVLYIVRNSVSAGDLKVGDCFDVPAATTLKTVDHHPCTEPHTGEVILVAEYDGDSYPISLSLDRFLEDNCVPAFATYVGREIDATPDLTIGYFYPSRDGWDEGDRTITCYVTRMDEGPTSQSVNGAAP